MGIGSSPKNVPQQDYVFFAKLRKGLVDLAALRVEFNALAAKVAKLVLAGTGTGADGADGQDGADGVDGADGAPGRALRRYALLAEDNGMFTLNATDTIGAVAATPAVIRYSFHGITVVADVDTFPDYPDGLVSNAAADIWPALAGSHFLRLVMANESAAGVSVTLFRNGTTERLVGTFEVPSNGTAIYSGGAIKCFADNGALVS